MPPHTSSSAGLYNGAVLPPAIYISGGAGVPSNRSLTLSNMAIEYENCNRDIWTPVVYVLYNLPAVRQGSLLSTDRCCDGLSSHGMQAGLSWHYDSSQTLLCEACVFTGHDPLTGVASPATIALYNTTVTCLSLTGLEAELTDEAAAVEVSLVSDAC